jgi:urease accessory protein UreE
LRRKRKEGRKEGRKDRSLSIDFKEKMKYFNQNDILKWKELLSG